MRKFLLSLVLLCVGVISANAQAPILWGLNKPYGGSTAAIASTGYSVSNGPLFATAISKLQFGTPYSVAYWVKSNAFSQATNWVLDARSGGSTTGFASGSFFNGNQGFVWAFFGVGANNNICANRGQSCVRLQTVNDGNWHLVVDTFDGLTAITYIDGIAHIDINTQSSGSLFVPTTGYWILWNVNSLSNGNARDMRAYSRVLSQYEISTLYLLGTQGKVPTAAPFTTGLVAYWPLGNCTNVGTNSASCPDSTATPANFVADGTPPVVTITNPTNGATGLTGNVSLTATCTDSISCQSVTWYVDGANIGSSTTGSFAVTWATANFVDGAHTISAQAINAGAVLSTLVSITASTSNGVSAKSLYIAAAGVDSGNCQSSGSPCLTVGYLQSQINSQKLHGGDSVLFHAGDTFTFTNLTSTTSIAICGPLAGTAANCSGQNAFPGATITIGTYGGSGNCHVLAGVTTDCVKLTMSGSTGTLPYNTSAINIVNMQNTVEQNFVISGTGAAFVQVSNCTYPTTGCGTGIDIVAANGGTNGGLAGSNNIAQNIEAIDFPVLAYPSAQLNFATGGGTMCGVTIQDNYLHGSVISAIIDEGILTQGANCVNANVSISTISNYINNTGGQLGNSDGYGISQTNGIINLVDTYNVTTNGGYNDHECGGMYGIEWFKVKGFGGTLNLVYGNESALIFPSISAGCDKGAFDIDGGASGIQFFFNYGHEVWGPAVNVFPASASPYLLGNNNQAYNVMENFGAQTNASGSPANDAMAMFSRIGYNNIYNNSIWNGYNGTIVSPNSFTSGVSAFGGTCPVTASVFANNIAVANKGTTAAAPMFYGSSPEMGTGAGCATATILTNDWYQTGGTGTPSWVHLNSGSDGYTTIGTWNTAIGSGTDQLTNPSFAGSGGAGVQCYVAASGVPVQPGSIPCPTNYELNNNTNVLIGAGTDLTTALAGAGGLPATDYYTNTIPNGVSTGYNIGADGGHH